MHIYSSLCPEYFWHYRFCSNGIEIDFSKRGTGDRLKLQSCCFFKASKVDQVQMQPKCKEIMFSVMYMLCILIVQSDWLRYSLLVNSYRVAASNATRPSFSPKSNAYPSFFEIILKK